MMHFAKILLSTSKCILQEAIRTFAKLHFTGNLIFLSNFKIKSLQFFFKTTFFSTKKQHTTDYLIKLSNSIFLLSHPFFYIIHQKRINQVGYFADQKQYLQL